MSSLRPHETTVAVTGANGFIASEIIAQLLMRGYKVHGTVRDPNNIEKVGHLKSFVGSKHLRLFKADLDSSKAFEEAFHDCQIVIHTASPLPFSGASENDLVLPALNGTKNVFDAIAKTPSVKIVVLTSSVASISTNAGLLPETHVYSEADWSPVDRLRELQKWYPLGKTLAEKAAWDNEIVKSGKVKLRVINPGLVTGAITNKHHASGTSAKWLNALNGEWKAIPNCSTIPVDVHDVAKAHLRAFEDPEAEGRYACVAGTFTNKEVVDALNRIGTFENLQQTVEDSPYKQGVDLWNNRKCEKLIGGFRTLDQTAYAMTESYKALGLIKTKAMPYIN